jgi:5'-nucleotidase
MEILITNDDGITSEGICELARQIKKVGRVHIVAPDAERSAIGHAITLSIPLRVKEIQRNHRFFGHAVNGTPADCVKIAIRALLPKKPDLVISGINLGPNIGTDIIYSGTVSAATEGTILGIPSIAVSLTTYTKPDFEFAARFTRKLARFVFENGIEEDTLLNVNIPALPAKKIRGVRITRQAKSRYLEKFDARKDPRQRMYYWLTGEMVEAVEDGDTDSRAIKENYISITPIQFDMTNYRYVREIRKNTNLFSSWCT